MRSACLASLLRRWFACEGSGGGEQHYEFPGLPRDRGRLSSSQEPTQLQLLAVHEMESCDIEVCTCIWDFWVKAMQCQSAHVPNDVGRPVVQRALKICLSTIAGRGGRHDHFGQETSFYRFYSLLLLARSTVERLACCVLSDGGGTQVLSKLAVKSASTVNFENCTSLKDGDWAAPASNMGMGSTVAK